MQQNPVAILGFVYDKVKEIRFCWVTWTICEFLFWDGLRNNWYNIIIMVSYAGERCFFR